MKHSFAEETSLLKRVHQPALVDNVESLFKEQLIWSALISHIPHPHILKNTCFFNFVKKNPPHLIFADTFVTAAILTTY